MYEVEKLYIDNLDFSADLVYMNINTTVLSVNSTSNRL